MYLGCSIVPAADPQLDRSLVPPENQVHQQCALGPGYAEEPVLERHVATGPPRLLIRRTLPTLEWVDWYNNRRLFGALGDIPPAEAESAYYATMTPSESPRMAERTLH